MNVFLLYSDRDFDLQKLPPWNEKDLVQDLELETIFTTMANGDELVLKVAEKIISDSAGNNPGTIIYRQDIVKDCLKNPAAIQLMYDISTSAIESRKKSWLGIFTKYPSSILSDSRGMLQLFLEMLKKLRNTANENRSRFHSQGFTRFFNMLQAELTDEYFNAIQNHLDELRFKDGMLVSYELGTENKGIHSTLRRFHIEKQSWFRRIFRKKKDVFTFYVHPRDESGARALSQINDEGINQVANALARSNDHILHFFTTLQTELAFYIGCLNLHRQLKNIQAPVCFPVPLHAGQQAYSCNGLYDACLALRMKQRIVSNDLNADGRSLVMITGANQGGKSTFLRSIGLAQLLMQSGLFVPAEQFSAHTCNALFTHFKREEDTTMKSGKFDEELSRMSRIADHIQPHSLLLFNESFAATNEKEGSEIAGQIVKALLEKNLNVFFVTHLYDFAHSFWSNKKGNAVFLVAERGTGAARTFKLKEGEPLQTSYGVDIYNKVFENK